jgi:hypothetical protein
MILAGSQNSRNQVRSPIDSWCPKMRSLVIIPPIVCIQNVTFAPRMYIFNCNILNLELKV